MDFPKERTQSADINTTNQPNKVHELLNQLVAYTEGLTEKIYLIKERHHADFQIAFKNYMIKVKKDLLDLKQKSDEHDKVMYSNDKMVTMEKELTFFRDECMKLYQKLENKNKENYELKFRIQELSQEKDHLENQTKTLMKRLRLLEINQQSDLDTGAKVVLDQTFCTSTQHQQKLTSRFKRRTTELSSRIEGTNPSIHYTPIRELLDSKVKEESQVVIDEIVSYIRQTEQKYIAKISQYKQKIASLISTQNKVSIIRSDLEHFFLECVESVRREVLKRRPPGQLQQVWSHMDSIKDYSIFRKEDKLKILELVLSNEKILVFLYQKIFPNHISVVLQQLKEDNNIQMVQSQRQSSLDQAKHELPKTQREARSYSQKYNQLEVKKGKLLFKQF